MKKNLIFAILPVFLLSSCKRWPNDYVDLTTDQVKQNIISLEPDGYEIKMGTSKDWSIYGCKDGYRWHLNYSEGLNDNNVHGTIEYDSEEYAYDNQINAFTKDEKSSYKASHLENSFEIYKGNYIDTHKDNGRMGYKTERIGETEFLGRKVTEYHSELVGYVKFQYKIWSKIFGLFIKDNWVFDDIETVTAKLQIYIDNLTGFPLYYGIYESDEDPWQVSYFKTGNDVKIPELIEKEPLN